MSIPSLPLVVSLICALAISVGAAGAEPSPSSHPCASKAEPSQRLACYDATFPPAIDPAARAAAEEAKRQAAIHNFGLNAVQVRERQPESQRAPRADRIEAAVVKVSNLVTGERVITLDNHQAWLLTEATFKGHLVVGDRVVVRTAALGTFMLITPGRVSLRARRIK